ncbi:Rv1733c family protein, partial [Streptomyces diastatochromogenes]|uniref:Rv1733c family protein n=1 Tax=Streptomyces diastatochromogenes TaxID=42236 RepID=UPI003CC5CC48
MSSKPGSCSSAGCSPYWGACSRARSPRSRSRGGLDRQRAERREVQAVVTRDAVGTRPTRKVEDQQAWAAVRWRAPDGTTHTDRARVPPDTRAGARITVWTDGHGNLTDEPLSPTDAAFREMLV